MADPILVSECLLAMREATSITVTVKHRLGIDHLDSYEDLVDFVATVARSGVRRFTVHARKAWLKGLSPRQNREVPPLRYELVYRLKHDLPHLLIELNGGVRTIPEATRHLKEVDAVMIGRGAYENPYVLAVADVELFGDRRPCRSRREVVEAMLPYLERHLTSGEPANRVVRHMFGLFNDQQGAKSWRRHLSENGHRPGVGPELLLDALKGVPDRVLDERPDASSSLATGVPG